MTDHPSESQHEPAKTGGVGSKILRFFQLIVRNPTRSAQFGFFALIAIIVLQNLESTSIDVLFWSITSMPKLVLIFLSMIIGAAAWEIVRRLTR